MVIILVCLIMIMLLLMSVNVEMFANEESVVIDDPTFDAVEYTESSTTNVDSNLIEKLVLVTNKYVTDKTGICSYVIETTSLKKFVHKDNKNDLYRCMFMLMKQRGFAFGFSVTVDIAVYTDGTARVMSARTQPIDVKPPLDRSPFESNIEGQDFMEYERFRENELKLIKNK